LFSISHEFLTRQAEKSAFFLPRPTSHFAPFSIRELRIDFTLSRSRQTTYLAQLPKGCRLMNPSDFSLLLEPASPARPQDEVRFKIAANI
jgi:hypothetical protein